MNQGRTKRSKRRPFTEAAEALVIVDMVESVKIADDYGWPAVGRPRMQMLRESVDDVCSQHGLSFRKFTGDGYLMAFAHNDHDLAVVHAVQAIIGIAHDIQGKNQQLEGEEKKQRLLHLRFAINFGDVDIINTKEEKDREGLAVSFVFRMEGKGKEFSEKKQEESFPTHDYAIVGPRAEIILRKRAFSGQLEFLGKHELKGFVGSHDLFLLSGLSTLDPDSLFSKKIKKPI